MSKKKKTKRDLKYRAERVVYAFIDLCEQDLEDSEEWDRLHQEMSALADHLKIDQQAYRDKCSDKSHDSPLELDTEIADLKGSPEK